MAYAFPVSIPLEAQLNAVWTDISAYQVGEITGRDGFGRIGFMDRVASQGNLGTKLNNLGGEFTPYGATMISGWVATVPIRLNVEYDGVIVNVFTGWLGIPSAQTVFPALLSITAFDWIASLSKFRITEQELLTDRTIDDAVRILLTHVVWQPDNLRLHVGKNIFPTVFDDLGEKGTPAGEISKLVKSELGSLYMRRDNTLVLESMETRARILPKILVPAYALDEGTEMLFEDGVAAEFEDGVGILFSEVQATTYESRGDDIPVVTEDCEEILFEDGELAIFEDGVQMVFNDVEEAVFDDFYKDMDVEDGPHHFNVATVTAFPRYTDATPVRVYRLGSPLALPAGVQVQVKGSWTNPNSGESIGAFDVDVPAQNTNYTVNAKENGAGGDLTSQLVVDEWHEYANGFEALVTSPAGGWLTKWELNGLGIYANDQAAAELSSAASIAKYGETSLEVDQRYLNDFAFSKGLVAAELLFQQEKRREGTRVYLSANRSSKHMMAFLHLQTGDVVHIVNSRHEIDSLYTIYDRDYTVLPGKVIHYSWAIKRLPSQSDMTEVELQCAVSASTVQEAAAIGVIPNWATRRITLFCEVYVTSVSSMVTLLGLPFLAGGDSTFFRLQLNSAGVLVARTSQFATAGAWTSSGDSVGAGAWVPVAVTYSSESLANVPSFYIDGVLQSVTGPTQPTGARVDEPVTFLEVGGHIKAQTSTSYDIRVRRHRWFNDILTADEIAALNASPDDYSLYSDRLLLGGFGVPNEYYADWEDAVLSETVKLVDLVAAVVPTAISGTPTIRALT